MREVFFVDFVFSLCGYVMVSTVSCWLPLANALWTKAAVLLSLVVVTDV